MEPTTVAGQSQSLIDICKTNTPYKIVTSGVMTLGISDHFLVYLVGKAHYTNPGCVNPILPGLFLSF